MTARSPLPLPDDIDNAIDALCEVIASPKTPTPYAQRLEWEYAARKRLESLISQIVAERDALRNSVDNANAALADAGVQAGSVQAGVNALRGERDAARAELAVATPRAEEPSCDQPRAAARARAHITKTLQNVRVLGLPAIEKAEKPAGGAS